MNFLNASWRGVPFGVLDYGLDGGRRTVTHEFPKRDEPYTEDLGAKAESFSLNAFILAEDATAVRAFLDACRQSGPGTLVHPWLGSMELQLREFSLREAYDAQRLSSWTLGFVQVGKAIYPTAPTNPGTTIANHATAAVIRSAERMQGFVTARKPQAVRDEATSTVGAIRDAVKASAQRAARPNTQTGQDVLDRIRDMGAFLRDCDALVTMISDPVTLAYSLGDVLFRISGLGMSSFEAYVTYKRLFDNLRELFDGLRFASTPRGRLIRSNAYLLRDATLTTVLAGASLAAVDADFVTYQAAREARSTLASMFDSVMAELEDDALFSMVQDARTATLTALPAEGETLRSIDRVEVFVPLPTLVLAYDLMRGVSDEQTIIDRNGVRDPWFCPNDMETRWVEILR